MTRDVAALDASGLDLNLLLEEIRQLRKQMTRAIDNNNRLRRSLEQNLANQRAAKQQQQQSRVSNGDASDSSQPMTREEMRSSSRSVDVEVPRKLTSPHHHAFPTNPVLAHLACFCSERTASVLRLLAVLCCAFLSCVVLSCAVM